ncbi:hydroxymethylbilane synthase [Corynebacterium sp. CCM 9203]|uniref:hydroxymethylbilane synthase n=1 Tax=Corynebacterium sp. CCM 9203 TaxID=3057615 RepID=UPI0035252505
MTFRIGTRGSQLATTQAGTIRDTLISAGFDAELTIISTPGDRSQAPVERIGVGVFTQALRDAMAAGECDLAVHSFKDLPTAPDPRFRLIVPVRADSREALIARDGLTLSELPEGARVGTSAPRRVSQLRGLRPDLDIQPLRGNIDTRMGHVFDGRLDAVVLAYAGLERTGMGERATEVFSPDVLLPAPAQGALAVECRESDPDAVAAIETLSDPAASACAAAERRILSKLEAGCTAPVASHATIEDGRITLTAGVFALDGSTRLVLSGVADVAEHLKLGDDLARQLLDRGAADVMADAGEREH